MFGKVKCPKCGEKNDLEDKKCFYCGEKLTMKNKSKKEKIGVPPIYAVMIAINMLLLLVAIALGAYSVYQMPREVESYVNSHKDDLRGEKGEKGSQGAQGSQGATGRNGANGTSSYNPAPSTGTHCTTTYDSFAKQSRTTCY